MRTALLLLIPVAAAMAQDRIITADSEVRVVAFSKDGNTVLGIGGDRKLRSWDARSGSLRNTTGWSADERPAALVSGSGLFALIGKDGITLTELDSGAVTRRVPVGDRRLSQVAIASNRQMLAGSTRVAGNSREEKMRLFDVSGMERFEAPSGIGGTSSLAFSPDGAILAAGSWDTNLRAWNSRNGELLALIEELPVAMFGIAFSPDGKHLATAGVDGIVYLWDSKTWKLARKFVGHPEMISSLAFSADGRFLATGGFNDITQAHPVSILIWDVASGKTVRTLPAPHRVSSVAFSPDGSLLAAAAGDKNVRLWKIK
jgi:WD40 repeat protein